MKNDFLEVAMVEQNSCWDKAIQRMHPLYARDKDIRTPFYRDYTRILHSRGFRRLKHKTQVFYATDSDHICTRIEHVQHVEAVSKIICQHLGLNIELASAISLGHDLGHAPFGHAGEEVLAELARKYCNHFVFWHERNGLRFVDHFVTLPDPTGKEESLDLTYAVRDGILCHCGEVDDLSLFPRTSWDPLQNVISTGLLRPVTWEGCVVRISDKISYLGRDIEDAIALRILTDSQMDRLQRIYEEITLQLQPQKRINNTVLIHELIVDLCANSSPETGFRFSNSYFNLLQKLRTFSVENIYEHPRLRVFKKYADLMIRSIFLCLLDEKKAVLQDIGKWRDSFSFPLLAKYFSKWLLQHSTTIPSQETDIYPYILEQDYVVAIIEFISGMTDAFIMRVFEEMTRF